MTLTRPAFGGTVVGRLADGRIIFVEGGAPGDEAVVEITRLKRRFAWGRVIEITTPGAGRATLERRPCTHRNLFKPHGTRRGS